MHILYLGYLVDDTVFDEISRFDSDISIAAHKFESCFIKQLQYCLKPTDSVEIISFVPFRAMNVSGQYIHSFRANYVASDRNNLGSIKNAVIQAKQYINDWYERTEGQERIVISYATNPILLAAFFLKKKCKVVTICSEVPKLRIMTNGSRMKNRMKKFAFHFFNSRMDAYIFMSKHMNDVCNHRGKPWIVVEGMTEVRPLQDSAKYEENTLFYAGGLFKEYGIDTLLQAIHSSDLQLTLIICGDGNAREDVIRYANADTRIQYLGVKNNADVMDMERKATLLINPRKQDNVISRYSFPSKTFEYFASGTPSMITKLDGIPDEYYKYCYTCDASSPASLLRDIKSVLAIPREDRDKKARDAYYFLKREKSAEAQTGKIVEFVYRVAGQK